MKKLFTVLILAFLHVGLVAQNNTALVKEIATNYSTIRTKLNSYDTTMVDMWEESTEGSQVVAYFDGEALKMLQITAFGETGKNILEYYFEDQKVIFAFDQAFEYNRPIYWNKKMAKKNGDTEVFDPNKTTVQEDRYYFNDEKLFLWLDQHKKEVDLTLGTNSITGQGLIAYCYKVLGNLK